MQRAQEQTVQDATLVQGPARLASLSPAEESSQVGAPPPSTSPPALSACPVPGPVLQALRPPPRDSSVLIGLFHTSSRTLLSCHSLTQKGPALAATARPSHLLCSPKDTAPGEARGPWSPRLWIGIPMWAHLGPAPP